MFWLRFVVPYTLKVVLLGVVWYCQLKATFGGGGTAAKANKATNGNRFFMANVR